MLVVELDLGHLEAAAPLGLVPQTILERPLGVLLGEELYRFRVVKLGERVQMHAQSVTSLRGRGAAGAPLTGFLQVAANMVPMFLEVQLLVQGCRS
jgi:hypothetical protein